MHTFVNPLPGIPVFKWLCFDYPLGYRTRKCLPNIDLKYSSDKPVVEEIYGQLGVPARAQGHPCMREYPFPEAEDPYIRPYHDQIVDVDRATVFDHTGRLSGSFARYLVQANHKTIVRMHVVPLTDSGEPAEIWNSGYVDLMPQAEGPNVWYWHDSNTRKELIFTAHAIVEPGKWAGLNLDPGIYKLVINWEFWDFKGNQKERMPISGFSDAISFELSEPTARI